MKIRNEKEFCKILKDYGFKVLVKYSKYGKPIYYQLELGISEALLKSISEGKDGK